MKLREIRAQLDMEEIIRECEREELPRLRGEYKELQENYTALEEEGKRLQQELQKKEKLEKADAAYNRFTQLRDDYYQDPGSVSKKKFLRTAASLKSELSSFGDCRAREVRIFADELDNDIKIHERQQNMSINKMLRRGAMLLGCCIIGYTTVRIVPQIVGYDHDSIQRARYRAEEAAKKPDNADHNAISEDQQSRDKSKDNVQPAPNYPPVYLYVVNKDESLSLIAKKLTNNVNNYNYIAQYNSIENPDRIYINQFLVIPDDIVGNSDQLYHLGFVSGLKDSRSNALPREYYFASKDERLDDIAYNVTGNRANTEAVFNYNHSRNPTFNRVMERETHVHFPPELVMNKGFLRNY